MEVVTPALPARNEGPPRSQFQRITRRGACGKARVGPQNRRPDQERTKRWRHGKRVLSKQYVLGLHEVGETEVAAVGGKGAHLGELSQIDGIRVPAGFCVTTDAFRRVMAEAPSMENRLDQLSRLSADDREGIRTISAEIRRSIEGIAIPEDLAAAISGALARLGERAAYAVR